MIVMGRNSFGFGWKSDRLRYAGKGEDRRIEMGGSDVRTNPVEFGKAVQQGLQQGGRHFVSGVLFLNHGHGVIP